jgi:predicted nucleotidyltransferase
MNSSALLDPIFSTLRQKVLAAILLRPEKQWYMLELAKYLCVSRSSLQRELASLLKAEILIAHQNGNRVYYQANLDCPILPELQSIMNKTIGVFDLIQKALSPLSDRIEVAFIFGSFAQSTDLVSSDIDLMVVGGLGLADVAVVLRPVQQKINREISPVVLSTEEAAKKLRSKDHFLSTVQGANKFFFIGAGSELGKAFSGA